MDFLQRRDEWGLSDMFKPPAGTTVNYNDPPSLALLSLILFPILTAISVGFVVLRIAYNCGAVGRLRADDWCILVAVICATTQVAIDLTETKFARHAWDIPISWLNETWLKKIVFAQSMIAWPALLFAKLSILLLYLRLFNVNRTTRWAIYAGMLWTLLTYLPFLIVTPYLCAPHVGKKWTLDVAVRCNDAMRWEITSAAMAVVLDTYIFALPLPILKALPLSQGRKWGLGVVFGTASGAIICAILTLVYRIRYKQGGDMFYNSWILIITAVIENNVAITIACVPGVSAFIKKYILRRPISSTLAKSRTRGHYALNSIGGTPLGSVKSDQGYMHSTTHLSGWREAKDGKVYTEVTNVPGRRLLEPGITKLVEFDQRSSRGTEDGVV